jgi:hypothetical protein
VVRSQLRPGTVCPAASSTAIGARSVSVGCRVGVNGAELLLVAGCMRALANAAVAAAPPQPIVAVTVMMNSMKTRLLPSRSLIVPRRVPPPSWSNGPPPPWAATAMLVEVQTEAAADGGEPSDPFADDRVGAPQRAGGSHDERHCDRDDPRVPGHDVREDLVEEGESGQCQRG